MVFFTFVSSYVMKRNLPECVPKGDSSKDKFFVDRLLRKTTARFDFRTNVKGLQISRNLHWANEGGEATLINSRMVRWNLLRNRQRWRN
jgi:hypothetical protein